MTSRIQADIPALACIEAQLMSDAMKDGVLSGHTRKMESHYGLPNGTMGSGQARHIRVLSLRYLLVVVPRETWKNVDLGIDDVEQFWSVKTLAEKGKEMDGADGTLQFIRRIRNAVAHARFEIQSNGFEFCDMRPNKEPDFRVGLTFEQLGDFLEGLGQFFANNRNRIRRTH